MPSHRLFKLNSPQGWNTTKDHLSGRLLTSDEPPFGLSWKDLNEEMIFVASSRCSLGIDLGWYPDYSPEGQIRIEVVDLDNLELNDGPASPLGNSGALGEGCHR
jgi:hypothetical protein